MTDLYVDTSALLKRVFIEAESARVHDILRERAAAGDLVVASELAWVEVSRSLLRAGVGDPGSMVDLVCSGVARHPLEVTVLSRARTVGPASLRPLDAIHLAAAISLGVTEILTYDERLAGAAHAVGLTPIS